MSRRARSWKGVYIDDQPKGWKSDPKDIHQHLVGEGALDLSESGIEAYKAIKTAWDRDAAR